MEKIKTLLLIIIAGFTVYTIGHASGPDDISMQWTEYCEMVAIYKATNGENGWPDYKDIYSEQCK